MEENVRKQVSKSLEETMKDFIDYPTNDDENNGLFSGIVVNNNDPDKLGKCQIRVYNIFGTEIPDSDLPWALPDFNFIGSTLGNFIVPPIGAIVKVYFDNGDIYLPHYTTKAVASNSQPSQKDIDYPDNMVMFETDEGDYLTINRKSKVTTYNHNSGTKIIIQKNGSVEINITGSESKEVSKNITIKSNQNIEIESIGTMHLKHKGNLTVDGTTVIPTGQGPFCAIPFDTLTGLPQTGNVCLP